MWLWYCRYHHGHRHDCALIFVIQIRDHESAPSMSRSFWVCSWDYYIWLFIKWKLRYSLIYTMEIIKSIRSDNAALIISWMRIFVNSHFVWDDSTHTCAKVRYLFWKGCVYNVMYPTVLPLELLLMSRDRALGRSKAFPKYHLPDARNSMTLCWRHTDNGGTGVLWIDAPPPLRTPKSAN